MDSNPSNTSDKGMNAGLEEGLNAELPDEEQFEAMLAAMTPEEREEYERHCFEEEQKAIEERKASQPEEGMNANLTNEVKENFTNEVKENLTNGINANLTNEWNFTGRYIVLTGWQQVAGLLLIFFFCPLGLHRVLIPALGKARVFIIFSIVQLILSSIVTVLFLGRMDDAGYFFLVLLISKT